MTQERGKLAANTHQLRVRAAHDGTFTRQGNAAGEHLNVVLLQAFSRTMLALESALITYLDAIRQNVVIENLLVHMQFFYV